MASEFDQEALAYHEGRRPGKLEVVPTKPLQTQRDLSLAYTPGVAEACLRIHATPSDVFRYTAKGNLVAVVTNGTAVLGLGDIGPEAGKPVMEGKANLFKKFADIDVFDIELDAHTVEEMLAVCKAIAPTFGGINLEDIKAPECFELERRLQEEVDIPVFHDDQHGTAIISAAALLNAVELTGREMASTRIVFSGAGAAAVACAKLYVSLGASRENIVMCDSRGVIRADRPHLPEEKAEFATTRDLTDLASAMVDADCFIGLSVGGVLSADMVRVMAPKPLIFAMANPDPEIPYALAKSTRPDAIVATGRSDHPNQVNNVLGFPFVFRGALDCRARKITEEMKVAATQALARLARHDVPDSVRKAYGSSDLRFGPDYIIPKPFDPRVLLFVAPAVAEAAAASGVAREPITNIEAYREQLHRLVERSRGLMHPLIRRARSAPQQKIVFPDGTNPAILRAAQVLVEERICSPILLGPIEKIRRRAEEHGVVLDGITLHHMDLRDELADAFWKLRQRKGVTLPAARAILEDRDYYAAMMVKQGFADGLVGGPGRAYKHTLRPALRILGVDDDHMAVSGVYVMMFDDQKLFFGDCTVNVDPKARTLAAIAMNTAEVAEAFGVVPRAAMLSFSDFGEHRRHPKVERVQEALSIVREVRPDLEIDGEMQADTAIDPDKQKHFPFSQLTDAANVLVFPDLTSGNIAYKLLDKLGAAEVLGPLLVGLSGAVNVIPVHATVREIVNTTTWTVTQALDAKGL
ncbi:MAG: NADP-dependent malic enzyme [Alphaproteobacteria bacterium]|nr:NADP-dependent malic enzyme [Alphaproteobacteria bacterium]MCB9692572.1 NADP-dependent malic enzyme [Alphaproteobacteria bacterium]